MRKSSLCLSLISALALGALQPWSGHLADAQALPVAKTTGTGSSGSSLVSPGDNGPVNSGLFDWSPPSDLKLAPSRTGTDGTLQTDRNAPWTGIQALYSGSSSATDAAASGLVPPLDSGRVGKSRWHVVTSVAETTTADDNISISHSARQSDVYFSLTPDIQAGWGDFAGVARDQARRFFDPYGPTREPPTDLLNGDFAYLNYAATATHFLDHDSQDSVDQDASFSGQWNSTNLLTGFHAHFLSLSGPEVDVGTRTRRQLFTIDLTSRYSLSEKTSFSMDAAGLFTNYATELNSSDWHTQLSADYQFSSRTSFGATVEAGLRQLQSNPNQYYQQVQLHAAYRPSTRLSLSVGGAVEIDEAGGSPQASPVFDLAADYVINEHDALSLDAYRQISNTALTSGETAETTGVAFELNHRVWSRVSLACSLGYNHIQYYQQGLTDQARTDDYLFFGPSLSYGFKQGSEIDLAYQFHRNLSTLATDGFVQNLVTLQFKFVF